MPLISIIVPVYNAGQYLSKCIESILQQSYENFELILVDDGSTDNSREICNYFMSLDKRVKVLHKENGGVSSARNKGMEIAQGMYYMFCDSDDYVSKDWCKHLISKVGCDTVNLAFCGIRVEMYDKFGTLVERMQNDSSSKNYPVDFYFELQSKNLVGFVCNSIYYARVIKNNNIFFPDTNINEDFRFNLEYLKYVEQIISVPHLDYNYTQKQRGSLSRRYYNDVYKKWQEKYCLSLEFIEERFKSDKGEAYTLLSNMYLYQFLASLNNTFDKRNEYSYLDKLKYNNQVIKSKEFKHCLRYADVSKENKLYIFLLKNTNYYIVAIFLQLVKLKQNIKMRKVR